MNERKGSMSLPNAPASFGEAIRAGAGDIRRYEIKRRRVLNSAAGIAAALLMAGVGAYMALGGMRPRGDDIYAIPGVPTPTTTPDPTCTLAPDATSTPAEKVTPVPGATALPMPSATASLLPMATPAPEDGEDVRRNIEMGDIIYGGRGYVISESAADSMLRGTPVLQHALYEASREKLDPDTVAYWLWGGDCRKETFDGGVVYTHDAKKNGTGDYKAKGYCFDGDNSFFYAPDDPSKLYAGDFTSREAALEWAGKWFGERLPEEYLANPAHPLQYGFEGERVSAVYGFRWLDEIEGVAVRGSGLSGDICAFGPNYFSLSLTKGYEPVPDEWQETPRYLTAAQAVDALNWAAAQAFAREAQSDMPGGDSSFGSFEDVIEDIRPIFANELFYRDTCYRLSWQITLRSAERASTREFIVDAATGCIWDYHEGAVDTIYTQFLERI